MEKAVKCTQNLLPDFAQVYSINNRVHKFSTRVSLYYRTV